jgi:hypothetical protein
VDCNCAPGRIHVGPATPRAGADAAVGVAALAGEAVPRRWLEVDGRACRALASGWGLTFGGDGWSRDYFETSCAEVLQRGINPHNPAQLSMTSTVNHFCGSKMHDIY